MNKKIGLAVLPLLFIGTNSAAEIAEIAEVACAEMTFSHSIESHDATLFQSLVDSDARFLGSAVLRGDDGVTAAWSGLLDPAGADLVWRPATVEVLKPGELAFSRGPYRTTTADGAETWGMYNSMWRRDDGGSWKVILDAGYPAADGEEMSLDFSQLLESPLPDVCSDLSSPGIDKRISVSAPLGKVWAAWTDEEAAAFVAGDANIELRHGGPFEWFLQLEPDAQGKRGAEGSYVLSWVPQRMLLFAWTYPPDVPSLRESGEFMHVLVEFNDRDAGNVELRLRVYGFREGDDYEAGREYFERAWGYVLDAMKTHLES